MCFVICCQLALVSPTGEQYDCLQKHLRERMEEGCGETIYVVGLGTGDVFLLLFFSPQM